MARGSARGSTIDETSELGLRDLFGAGETGEVADRRRSTEHRSPSRSTARSRQATSSANRVAVAVSVLGFVCWVVACLRMDPTTYTDLGLISATDGFFWVALVSGVVAFVCAVRARHFRWQSALLALCLLIAVLYATPSWIEGTPRVEAVYRHLGIADSLARTGVLERHLDAYFNWPGFFAMLGMVQRAAGLPDLIQLARWAPPVAALAYVAPVLLIARSLTPQRKVQWLAAGAVVLVNWTGQDYLSPQTFGFWLLLCIAGIVMSVIRRQDDPDAAGPSARIRAPRSGDGVHRLWVGDPGQRVRLSRAQWRAVHLLVLLAASAMIASHQLTPFMLVLALFGLWLVGRTPHWWLWAAVVGLVCVWLVVPAWPFVSGHLGEVAGSLTKLGAGGQANLGGRVANGSPEHHLVVNARMAQTVVVWLIAGLGTLLLISERRRIRGVVLLAALPFVLVPLQTYGGEMLIRAYLFGLPVVGFLVGVFLFWVGQGRQRWRGVALAAVLLALASTTVLTRYGNERGESFRPAEVQLMKWFFDHTPEESTVEMIDPNSPRAFHRYTYDIWIFLEDAAPGPRWKHDPTPDRIVAHMAKEGHGKPHQYLVYTPSQAAMAELSGNVEPGVVQQAVRAIDRDPRFRLIRRTDGGSIWERVQ